jgi:hypothetical protein
MPAIAMLQLVAILVLQPLAKALRAALVRLGGSVPRH